MGHRPLHLGPQRPARLRQAPTLSGLRALEDRLPLSTLVLYLALFLVLLLEALYGDVRGALVVMAVIVVGTATTLHQTLVRGERARLRDQQAADIQEALRASEMLNRSVLDALPAQIAVLDASGTIVAVNNTWLERAAAAGDPGAALTGIGHNYLEMCRRAAPREHDAAVVLMGLEDVLSGARAIFTYEYPCATPAGLCWYLVYITPFAHGAVLAHFDITDRKELEEEREMLIARLHNLAQTDVLTGLANRRAFMDDAERAWAKAERSSHTLAMIMLDVDRFKQINDTYGHQAGDEVLREVASRCQASLRAYDRIGRYGGEEFAVLVANAAPDDAIAIAERLRSAVAEAPILLPGHALDVTVSVGVSLGAPPAESLTTLLVAADAALYAAKRAGRNRVATAGALLGLVPPA